MKKVLSIFAVVLFSLSMYNCTEESIQDENETYATGKDCSSSGGDKEGCDDD